MKTAITTKSYMFMYRPPHYILPLTIDTSSHFQPVIFYLKQLLCRFKWKKKQIHILWATVLISDICFWVNTSSSYISVNRRCCRYEILQEFFFISCFIFIFLVLAELLASWGGAKIQRCSGNTVVIWFCKFFLLCVFSYIYGYVNCILITKWCSKPRIHTERYSYDIVYRFTVAHRPIDVGSISIFHSNPAVLTIDLILHLNWFYIYISQKSSTKKSCLYVFMLFSPIFISCVQCKL